jgi:hypothetical protein
MRGVHRLALCACALMLLGTVFEPGAHYHPSWAFPESNNSAFLRWWSQGGGHGARATCAVAFVHCECAA